MKNSLHTKIYDLIDKAETAEKHNTEAAINISLELLKIPELQELPLEASKNLVRIGRCLWIKGDYDISIEYLEKALVFCSEANDNYALVDALIVLANVYKSMEWFNSALLNYGKALVIAEDHKLKELISKIYNNIGALHEETKNYDEALEYFEKCLNMAKEIKNEYIIAISYLNIGHIKMFLDNNEDAKKDIIISKEYFDKHNRTIPLAHSYYQFGIILKKEGNYDESIKSFKDGIFNAEKGKDSSVLFRIYLEIAEVYILLDETKTAEIIYFKALTLAKKLGMSTMLSNVYEKMALYYQKTNNNIQAIKYFNHYNNINNEIEDNRMKEIRKSIELQSKLSESKEETKIYRNLSTKLEKSYNDMKVLSKIGQAITSTRNIEKIFENLYKNVNHLMPADSLTLGLYNPETNKLHFDLSIEKGEYLEVYSMELNHKNSWTVWCYNNKKTVRINDFETEYHDYIESEGESDGDEMNSAIFTPLVFEDEVIGVFTVQAEKRNSYTEADEILLFTLSSYLAIAIKNASKTKELAKLNEKLKIKSEQDGLIGIANRRLFDEKYTESWEVSVKNKENLLIMMMDIDNFKDLNDKYGHLTGDEVLKAVGKILEEEKDENSFVARYGGDEFVAIFSQTSKSRFMEFDNRFRTKLFDLNITLNIKTKINVSIGVALITPKKEDNMKTLIYSADEQLYSSKANGKNQTSFITIKK
ncbi:hypothetical protein CI105_08355 [Candidatus Izimaplasma bacterium ZiA1]|uniref:diguanylate cyclase n=1 Tax=Candidatus Izimoplasma sp. ZiA1 TaxID=2024899 RepID=UPI000BAA5443|nr:hypothetical protein CI105_08355 [Candidatus Izimaplasma bacterium ZiA1]